MRRLDSERALAVGGRLPGIGLARLAGQDIDSGRDHEGRTDPLPNWPIRPGASSASAFGNAETQAGAVAFRTHHCLARQRTQLINALGRWRDRKHAADRPDRLLARRRVFGLATGFSGVALAMLAAAPPEAGGEVWLLATLALPMLLAIQNLLMARPILSSVDPFGALTLMLMISAGAFGLLAVAAGHELALASVSLGQDLPVAGLGLAT